MEIQPISTTEETPNSKASSVASSQNSHASNHQADPNPMQSWWVSISKARSRIESLASILFSTSFTSNSASISSLADSDRPSRALLDSPEAYDSVSSFLSRPISGSGDDPLCQWLYETYQSSDPDLRLVVISFLPILSGLYLSRVISGEAHSLSGFEAVILSIYAAETKARAGKPVTIAIPDMSQPSLYHTPRQNNANAGSRQQRQQQQHNVMTPTGQQLVSFVCPPLEPQTAVKSTKRACIVGVALDCYYKKISLMPSRSKVNFCEFAAAWAGQDCSCRYDLDQDSVLNTCSSTGSDARALLEDGEGVVNNEEDMGKLAIAESPMSQESRVGNGGEVVESSGSVSRQAARIPLPWELLQPMLKIIGHCLLGPLNAQDLRDAASASIRSIYARASHDLMPQAILASRSLIQLDNSTRISGKNASVMANSTSNPNTPSKPRKPEVFLVSK